MRATKLLLSGFLLMLGAWLIPTGAEAMPGAAWRLNLVALPSHLSPGTTGQGTRAPIYELFATNVGGGDANGPITFKVTLPQGVSPLFGQDTPEELRGDSSVPLPICEKNTGQTVACTASGPIHPSRWIGVRIPVEVSGSLTSGEVLADATANVESPGTTTAAAKTPTIIDTAPPDFGFLEGLMGLATLFTREDGSPAVTAGSHPSQLTIDLGFPVEQAVGSPFTANAGHPRDIVTDLPTGVVINPNATARRCTEAEFLASTGPSKPGCPAESQIGVVTLVTENVGPLPVSSQLFNMVPPPGSPAEVAFDAAGVGVFVHLIGGVRSESDFGLFAESKDTLARGTSPIEHVQVELWGEPTSETHDQSRGPCLDEPANFTPCKINSGETPQITMPSACSDGLITEAHARSWEEADEGIEELIHHASAAATTVSDTPTAVSQCSALDFAPSLTIRPDTAMAESPTGLEIDLKVPQSKGLEPAASTLKETEVTFPEGLVANAAAAGGQKACTPSEIGMLTPVDASPIHLSNDRARCPDAAKLGALRVKTPLLDHPLPGSVYLAEPYENPFGTLLAAYLVIDSPQDGIVAKLASRIEADPDTGQLTASVEEAPQLPMEEVKIELFGGTRAALRTPVTCGTFSSTSMLTPWSGNPPVPDEDSFEVTKGPNGKPCVKDEAEMPNDPGFEAGTQTPVAANYSTFLARLTREDGEQQLKSFNMTFPAGLSGKLAGVGTCSEGAIEAAKAKSGQEELQSPSCPPDSLIGKVEVGAGAGPTPYYTTGKIYMAGPWKGAPLSAVAITPAVAGPFDLGNVAIRVPAYVDPVTSVLSIKGGEEFPHILEGVPLELRDARVALDRKEFTLNPTSCSEKALTGEAISLFDQNAPLFQRFQVAGCRGLDYAPKLAIRLFGKTNRGAHPRVRAILTAKPGEEANTAKASVALPRSEFLENAHIQTACTRVQFAAEQCPAGSIYGHAQAFTPILDEPIEGPIYLRSSSHELPDMVAALKGPPNRPIKVELAGRIDSVNGGIRTTFDLVPDQPVAKAIFSFKGGNKGLIVNSRDICARTYKATAKFDGQNGKTHDFKTKLKASCKGKAKARKGHRRR